MSPVFRRPGCDGASRASPRARAGREARAGRTGADPSAVRSRTDDDPGRLTTRVEILLVERAAEATRIDRYDYPRWLRKQSLQ